MIKLVILAVVIGIGLLYFNKVDAGSLNKVVQDTVNEQAQELKR